MRRLTNALALCVLAVACGGGADDQIDATTPQAPDTTAAQPGSEQEAPVTSPAVDPGGNGDGSSASPSVGTLTIAGETFHFADTGFPGLQCMPSAFGVAFLAALQQVDEGGQPLEGSLTVGVPFKGQEETAGILPEVNGGVGEVEWIANPEHAELNGIAAGSSQVDSYEISGNTISGAGTFYEETSSFGGGELVVEQGTFEVTCAEA